MIDVIKYRDNMKQEWNEFLGRSKNATFLFNRNFMDYHSYRYEDHSLMFYKKNSLIALFPAHLAENELVSHNYLTFGGLLVDDKMKTLLMLTLFRELKKYSKQIGLTQIIYKAIPYIYHSKPSEEDIYALFRNDAKLLKREVSSCIYMPEFKAPLNRKNGYNKAVKNNVILKKVNDYEGFISIVNKTLKAKYGLKAVHTPDELMMLQERFPENIKLFGAYKDNILLGGAVIFQNKLVAHAQYLHASNEGRKVRCLDFILITLLKDHYKNFTYFDFGHSTEEGGKYLNESLISLKEEFGGSALCYDTYTLDI